MAYRIVTLISSANPAECVDEARVGRLAEEFGVRDVRALAGGASLDFRLPIEGGTDCYVEVDINPELIRWYATKYETEAGKPFDPMPNVYASWTVTRDLDVERMHAAADTLLPGKVVTAWDDVAGFGVTWR